MSGRVEISGLGGPWLAITMSCRLSHKLEPKTWPFETGISQSHLHGYPYTYTFIKLLYGIVVLKTTTHTFESVGMTSNDSIASQNMIKTSSQINTTIFVVAIIS